MLSVSFFTIMLTVVMLTVVMLTGVWQFHFVFFLILQKSDSSKISQITIILVANSHSQTSMCLQQLPVMPLPLPSCHALQGPAPPRPPALPTKLGLLPTSHSRRAVVRHDSIENVRDESKIGYSILLHFETQ
jgi:hypothetical protein